MAFFKCMVVLLPCIACGAQAFGADKIQDIVQGIANTVWEEDSRGNVVSHTILNLSDSGQFLEVEYGGKEGNRNTLVRWAVTRVPPHGTLGLYTWGSIEAALAHNATFFKVLAEYPPVVGNGTRGLTLTNNVLVVRLGFLTNFGAPLYPTCDAVCATTILWDSYPSVNDVFLDASTGTFALDKDTSTVVQTQLNVYASSLGCTTDDWAALALQQLAATPHAQPTDYVFK